MHKNSLLTLFYLYNVHASTETQKLEEDMTDLTLASKVSCISLYIQVHVRLNVVVVRWENLVTINF